MRELWERFRVLKGDRGEGAVSLLVGMAITFVVLLIPLSLFIQMNKAAQINNKLEVSQSSINEALNQAKQDVQIADPIIWAENNILVTEGRQGDGTPTRTRWVLSGNNLYQQSWTGFTGEYPFAGVAWIGTGTTSGTAPQGGGKQSTMIAVENLNTAAGKLFTYYDTSSSTLSVTPALTSKTGASNAIRRVGISLEAKVGTGVVKNTTSAATRNAAYGVATGSLPAPTCPDTRLVSGGSAPKLEWDTVAGITKYVVYRNTTAAQTVTVGAGASKGSWTDTSDVPRAGEAVTYRVTAKTDAGVESISCRNIVWRVAVDAPALTATLLPPGTEATAWNGAGLTKPQIRLDWNAVENATGYELYYRELNPTSGAPLTSGFTSAKVLDVNTRTFTFTGADWAKRYEWFIKASSHVGASPESRHNDILTHPKAPTGASVAAQYGAVGAADRMTHGQNVIKWAASATASRYEVWRYNSGTSGAVKKVCTTEELTCSDKVAYGTTYTYYVVAKNYGKRGYNAANSQPNVYAASSTPEGSAASKPAKVTRLQYPEIVDMVPLGESGSRDMDGYNLPKWNATATATGYHVYRVNVVDKKLTCLTGACTEKTSGGVPKDQLYYQESAGQGTQRGYAVRAYNATGLSLQVSEVTPITQRPAIPKMTVTAKPTLTSDAASFRITANGDAGNNAANKFCTASTCSYDLLHSGFRLLKTINHPGTDKPVNWTNQDSPPGVTTMYAVRSKNAAITRGGYSDQAQWNINTYPAPFTTQQYYGDHTGKNTHRFRLAMINSGFSGSQVSAEQNGYLGVRWGRSEGAANIRVDRAAGAYDYSPANGHDIGLPNQKAPMGFSPNGEKNEWAYLATPGATYTHVITAIGKNGLERPVKMPSITAPSDLPEHGKVIVVCSANTYSDQNSARWDHPNHRIGARLIDFDSSPKYGGWDRVDVTGLAKTKNGGIYATHVRQYTPGGNLNPQTSSEGMGYYFGTENGFDMRTIGAGGSSLTLRVTNITYATFNSGCGAPGATWGAMAEPTWACYGYVVGQTCAQNNPQNRPQWRAR